MRRTLIAAATLLPLAAAACSDGGPTQAGAPAGQVAIRFSTGSGVSASRAPGLSFSQAPGTLTIQGSNGTLALSDLRVIVSRFELRRVQGVCPAAGQAGANADKGGSHDGSDDHSNSSECRRFRAGPSVLALPLDGSPVTIATDSVPAGTYGSVKFKVENLEDEKGEMEHESGDDHPDEQAGLLAALAQIRTAYPSFPSTASMVAQGTFTPTGGAAQPFTVYFRANLNVEKPLSPPLVIPGSAAVTVAVDPSLWFKAGTQVLNLGALNGQTVAFGGEMEHGFKHGEGEHGSGHD
ncbi:MAG: hypothetical protein JWM27_3341 [Gemmatimonadetes bacterium]|nr:hypothetical protein [Gemmatimonadota bacterium]